MGSFRFAMGTAAAAAVAEFVACCALSLSRHNSSGRRVGFSGVLFSWVVVAAVAMPKYCVFGNACFTTFQFLYARLNIGPLFLAAAIQLVVPRASLTGHAAGIAVGFPLAWGFLDYLTPPVIATLLALIDAYLVDSPRSLSLRSTSAAILQTLAGTLCILYFPREHASSILAATNLAAALSSLVSTTRGNHTSLLLLPLVHALAFAGLAGTIQSRTSHHTAAIAAAAAHGTTALLFAQDHPRCFATIPPDVGGPVGKRVAVALRVIDALSIGPRECSLSRLAQKPSVTYSGAGNLHVPQEQKEPQSKTTRAPPSDNLDRA